MATASDEPNFAPVDALARYVEQNGAQPKPFKEWFLTKTRELEQQNSREWTELSLIWEMQNHFINGNQVLRRSHRFGGWVKAPLPETTTGAIRQQNKLGFYSHSLMAKTVASRTKIIAVPGDDSDESQGAARAAQTFADVIQPLVYSEKFRQTEGLAGQAHGSYARYFYFDGEDEEAGYAERPITEQRPFKLGEDTGECFDCGYVGSAGEFQQSGALSGGIGESGEIGAGSASGLDAGMVDGAGGVRPVEAAQGDFADPASADAVQFGGSIEGGYGAIDANICPACGSTTVEITPAPEEQIEVQTGTEKVKLGQIKAISVPYTELRHEIACAAEDSPWMRWKRRIRLEELKAAFPGLKIPPSATNGEDPGLRAEDSLRRSISNNGRGIGRSNQEDRQNYGDFTQWWFLPCMYADYVFPVDVQTVAGEMIPAGTRAADLFPDGMYIAVIEGIEAPLQVRNECHKWHWVTAPFHMRLFTGVGLGINDAIEMQRQWNVMLSLVFEQIRTASLPGYVYDKDAIAPDDVRLIGQPQNNVPVSLRNRPDGTRIEQLIYQMQPGQIPQHIPWYIGQLDANMQTSMGALVNEGVPGMDSKTATGAQLMASASAQHNAPEFALKGDADVRSMGLIFELAKKHYVDARYFALTGKRGKQDGVWLSAADFSIGQVRWEAVKDSWMPNTKLDKQEANQKFLMMFGGIAGLMQAQQAFPEYVSEVAQALNVEFNADEYEPTAILCRQRIDQILDLAAQYAPLAGQVVAMNEMAPAVTVDPMTGEAIPIDPMEMIGQELIGQLKPPVIPEEPAHLLSIKWLRNWLIDDQGKEADEVTRAAVQALIRAHFEAEMLVQQAMASMAMIANPQPEAPPGEGGGDKGGQPQKTEGDKRKDSAKANMGGQEGQAKRPSPRPQAQPAA